MATAARIAPTNEREAPWLWRFIKLEMEPYPGRAATVGRMVLAATVVMFLILTLGIPNAALGAYYALLTPRDSDSPRAMWRAAALALVAVVAGATEILVGAALFADSPVTHFLWVFASLFFVFFAIGTFAANHASTAMAYMITSAITLWDTQRTANWKVETTLFTLLAMAIGIVVATSIEHLFAATRHRDAVLAGLIERLDIVQQLLDGHQAGRPPDRKISHRLLQYTTIGTGHLRELLDQSDYELGFREQIGAALALGGHLVDLCSSMSELEFELDHQDRARTEALSRQIQELKSHLAGGKFPEMQLPEDVSRTSQTFPLLVELDRNVRLITQVFAGHSVDEPLPLPDKGKSFAFFLPDAFSNLGHMKFALRGCFSAMFCYVFYMGAGWPGINAALATTALTAFSDTGTSRQKQILRLMGALVGGILFGIGSQAFLLTQTRSIAAFALVFVAVSAVAAWVATSSPRLSYVGPQIALAYYLINLNSFSLDRSLKPATDRVIGTLLGLFAMWLIYDRMWMVPAAMEMKTLFLQNLRDVARFGGLPLRDDQRLNLRWVLHERGVIDSNFNKVRSLADAVLLEFGPQRAERIKLRNHIRAWQPELQTIFILKLSLVQHWLSSANKGFPPLAERVQAHVAVMLDGAAKSWDGKPETSAEEYTQTSADLLAELEQEERDANTMSAAETATVLALSHSMLAVAASFCGSLIA
ncbi:MAG: hypothetical protein ACYDC6_12960 [Acidobacteriaceae bacterium]